MATDERLDFSGQRVDNADFSHARLHSVNLEGARITDGWLRNTDIDAYVGGLKINGVEVWPLVDAELDRIYPDRAKLRADDQLALLVAWDTVEKVWNETVARARQLPEPLLDERVDGEWSFLETLRHLVFATDAWILRMVKRDPRPYHPWGLSQGYAGDFLLAIDEDAQPSLADVLKVRRQRMQEVKSLIEGLRTDELDRECEPPDATGYPQETRTVRGCFKTILDEEWAHSRYANRDLAILESRIGEGGETVKS